MKQVKMVFLLILTFSLPVIGGPGLDAMASIPVNQDTDEDTITNKIQLRLPVRVTEGVYRYKPLTKNDITLLINDQSREIARLEEKESSIAKIPELGRSFILSFHITEYTKEVADAVSYFTTDILNYSDMLFILTPLNVYRIDVSRNKLKMIRDIEELVNKDCKIYHARWLSSVKNLEREINQLKWYFRNPYQLPGPYFAAIHFFRIYPSELKKFNNQFWLPDMGKYQRIIDFLQFREGERWCIHFQQRDIYSIYFDTLHLLRELRGYFAVLGGISTVIKGNISMFERELSRMDAYSVHPLLGPILNADINYNSISFGSLNPKSPGTDGMTSFYLERLLKQTSDSTGGQAVITTDPREGIKEIINHRDRYYELFLDFNGDIEEKRIQVILEDNKTKLRYRETFSLEEIDELLHYLSKEKVKIADISTAANENEKTVSFAIRSFELREPLQSDIMPEKFGILRVRVQLHNQWGERIYASERMLRVTEQTVTVSHTVSAKYQGQFILNIFVMDLIRNSSVTFTGDITL